MPRKSTDAPEAPWTAQRFRRGAPSGGAFDDSGLVPGDSDAFDMESSAMSGSVPLPVGMGVAGSGSILQDANRELDIEAFRSRPADWFAPGQTRESAAKEPHETAQRFVKYHLVPKAAPTYGAAYQSRGIRGMASTWAGYAPVALTPRGGKRPKPPSESGGYKETWKCAW